jgi:DNA polymerase delta subunit 3
MHEIEFQKRALKRKSEAPNKSEAEETSSRLAKASLAPEPAKKASSSASVSLTQKVEPPKTARRKNNIVLSDEDEEDDQPVRAPAKSIPVARPKRKALAGSDDEDDLDKMMNLDDSELMPSYTLRILLMKPLGEVVHASKVREATTPPDTDDGMSNIDHHEEMYMDEDIDDVPKPKRKKKEKKVVPVGKNGIPKRRLVNTRTTLDAKGFMGTSSFLASQPLCLSVLF